MAALFEFDLQKKYERLKEEERLRAKGITEDKKRIVQVIKLYAPAGTARSGPPLSPVLGQHQLNVNDFCTQFNKITAAMDNRLVIPVFLYKKADKTFDLTLRPVTTTYYFMAYRKRRKKYGQDASYLFPLGKLRKVVARKYQDLARSAGELSERSILGTLKTVLGSAKSSKLFMQRKSRS